MSFTLTALNEQLDWGKNWLFLLYLFRQTLCIHVPVLPLRPDIELIRIRRVLQCRGCSVFEKLFSRTYVNIYAPGFVYAGFPANRTHFNVAYIFPSSMICTTMPATLFLWHMMSWLNFRQICVYQLKSNIFLLCDAFIGVVIGSSFIYIVAHSARAYYLN